MANTAQARKRARQNLTHQERNNSQRSAGRTALKRTLAAIEAKDTANAAKLYRQTCSLLDRLQKKNLIHRNKVARYKRQLNALIKAQAKA